MNTDTQLNTGSNNQTANFEDPDFMSIDDATGWPPFILSMLRIARIMTAKDSLRQGVSATQISAYMNRHREKIPMVYNGKEIRELFFYHGCYLSGGGVRIEGEQLEYGKYRTRPNYRFTISRLIRPEDCRSTTELPAPTQEQP